MLTAANEAESWPELQRVHRAIVVVDVVESVRLMQANEANTIKRWRRFVSDARNEVLSKHGGRLVKSLGDGMLLEFENAASAVAAALELQSRVGLVNEDEPVNSHIALRAGVNMGEFVSDELDVYGHEVNLASRLASLARGGEVVVSAEVRDKLVDGLDAEIEDLGDCWLKHVEHPVRAARVGPVGSGHSFSTPTRAASESIGIAVLPLQPRSPEASGPGMGDLLADDLIGQLSRLPQLRVISRLSTSAFRHRAATLANITDSLDVHYVLHGNYALSDGRVRVMLQLVERGTESVIWADTFNGTNADLAAGDGAMVDEIVKRLCAALVGMEVRRACSMPLPTLLSYTILLGAVSLLHSLSQRDFERSRDMLTYLAERHPRMPAPRAWLGLWHVMRVGQGWSTDPGRDAAMARSFTADALAFEPRHSLSLAVDGLVCAYVNKDLATAGERYDAALQANPNEGLAWLYQSAWYAYQEQGQQAVHGALTAQRLSPLDPMKYYYDNFTSTAMLAANDLRGAIDYGQRSLRANRLHGPTLRILAIAHALNGEMVAAREMVQRMTHLEPGFSVNEFRRRYPGRRPDQVERYAHALSSAGLPL